MRKTLAIIGLLITAFIFSSCSKTEVPGSWESLDTKTGDAFYSVNFVNDTVGWVNGQTDRSAVSDEDNQNSNSNSKASKPKPTPVNKNGKVADDPLKSNQGFEVLHTTDGGKTWAQIPDLYKNKIRSVWFADANNGWALTIDHDILHTTDGGATWTPQRKAGTVKLKLIGNLKTPTMDTTEQIEHIYFRDGSHGWAWGGGRKDQYTDQPGILLLTANGGANWNQVPYPFNQQIQSVCFTDNTHGWASISDGLYKTTDSGVTWTKVQTRLPEIAFNSMSFVNPNVGFVVGRSGRIARTTDGGRTWWKMVDIKQEFVMRDIHFSDETHGWAVGDNGALLFTADGGDTWTSANSPATAKITNVEFLPNGSGWAAGLDGTVLKFTPSKGK